MCVHKVLLSQVHEESRLTSDRHAFLVDVVAREVVLVHPQLHDTNASLVLAIGSQVSLSKDLVSLGSQP